ncbi:MAG: helix-turn-helix domain-containing protein [Deltaproteobacteria bacterium]
MSSARRPINSFLTRKAVYSEEEAFDVLFPDEKSRRVYHDEKSRMDRNLIDNICAGKVNSIRGWRILKGMDQKTLAEMTGIIRSSLSRIEKVGLPTPTMATLREIASALDVSVADLIHRR